MKVDPYKNKEKYLKWKNNVKEGIPNLSDYNSNLIKQYLSDMEMGLNVAGWHKKGSRSYIRLNEPRTKIPFLARKFEELLNVEKVTEITEEQLHNFFNGIRNGEIKEWMGKYTNLQRIL